mmetsp:Transcript_11321/g.22269  ORF Transcript_11321/g.22269 Transcript_11321/m.22269 type:complete len:368 (-) Transcript_11321:8-1111(-)
MGIICCVSQPHPESTQHLEEVPFDCGDIFEKSLYSQGVSVVDFKLERPIGYGCFGKTALVTHKVSWRLYALKLILKEDIYKPHLKIRPKRERDEIAARDNPFLVPVDFGFQDPKLLFIVSQFQPGGDLASRIRRVGRMSEDEARFYLAEIALGIAWFHDKQIIYRNLKPRNVLIDSQGHVRLSELSICLEQPTNRDLVIIGDPDYTAPEILKGFRYDMAADYWSLGVIMHELLTNKLPFEAQASRDSRMILQEYSKTNWQESEHLSPAAVDLLKRLLSFAPSVRLQNFDDLQEHPFFSKLSWMDVITKKLEPPFKPPQSSAYSLENFEVDLHNMTEQEGILRDLSLDEKLAMRVSDFTFIFPTDTSN